MNKTVIERFEKQLQELLLELEALAENSKASTATVVLDQSSVGRLSRMDAMQGQQMAMESERRRKEQILQLRAAIRRIAEDNFGYCVRCGDEIALARLSVNPSATRCVACVE